MSLVQPSVPERRPSPALSLNLSSNNPFRNRAASPQSLPSPSPSLPTPRTTAARPLSRNPFLSDVEQQPPPQTHFQTQFPPSSAQMASSPPKPSYATAAEELFAEMSLKDKEERNGPDGAAFPRPPGPPRSGTNPGRPPRRPSEDDRRRNGSGSRPPPRRPPPREELDIFKSPDRSENRRPRRNSESSIMDKHSMEEERRRRERRHRERKERESGRTKDGKVRKPRGLDIIDKLDVSGIYGPSMFHHDGPFDACNPHRNRKADGRAPMQAFPEGSANNAMGGSGPVNAKMNLDQFHGRGAEGFSDFSAATARPEIDHVPKPSAGTTGWYNPKADIEAIHGDESNGLGTSTFLEGAPASRKDMQRRDSENDNMALGGGGLARKKSLAQRIRGISQPRRDYGGRVVSPDAQYEYRDRRPPPPPPNGQASPLGPQSAGGKSKMHERNPFFDDYDDYDKKGASVRTSEQKVGRARAPSSPGRPNLERSFTCESPAAEEPRPSGFLTRMKSLKGGKRAPPRPERRPS